MRANRIRLTRQWLDRELGDALGEEVLVVVCTWLVKNKIIETVGERLVVNG